jgi:hypothetical protein
VSAFDDDEAPADDSDTPAPFDDDNPTLSVPELADEVPCPLLTLPLIRTPSTPAIQWKRAPSAVLSAALLYSLQRLRI